MSPCPYPGKIDKRIDKSNRIQKRIEETDDGDLDQIV